MTHPTVLQVQRLVETAQPKEAERALVAIAETEGDHALVELLDQLPADDLIAILREFDGSHDSILHHLITPEQFAASVTLEARYGEAGPERLQGIINSIVYHSAAGPEAYLSELASHVEGIETLALYFQGHWEPLLHFAACGDFNLEADLQPTTVKSRPSHFGEGLEEIDAGLHFGNSMVDERARLSRSEVADHDWMETAWLLESVASDAFEELVGLISSRQHAFSEASLQALGQALAGPADAPPADDEGSAI